jgi:hypothetical protein
MEINYIFYFNSYQSQDRLNQQYNNCTVQLHATYLDILYCCRHLTLITVQVETMPKVIRTWEQERVFRTYQQKHTVKLNNTISANSVEEYWELDKVESVRKSCCNEEATP